MFRVARRTEGLPNLGTDLSSLPTLQSVPPHSYPIARFHAAGSPFSSYSRRRNKTVSNVSWFHILSRCSRQLHTMARSHPHSRHHSRNRGTRPLDRLKIPFWLPADYHHRPETLESQLFHSLAKLCGIQLSRTTAYHPAANGLVERIHRTLKASIMCHADQNWTEALPLVLLGIRTSFKADLLASVAELVYGEPLRIPGELLTPAKHPVDPAYLNTQLRQHMTRLRPVPATRHANPGTFIHKDLINCTQVFLRQDSTCRAFQPPYTGPYQVLSRKHKMLKLLVHGKPITVSADRVKPAYIFNEDDSGHTISKHADTATLTKAPPNIPTPPSAIKITRSGRHVHFPVRFTS
jgi:hypothetical protein